jgi:rRNA maturation endonuclease Nob1
MIQLNRADGVWEITCDRCSSEFDSVAAKAAETSDAASRVFQQRGWKPFKDIRGWKHRCPGCLKEMKAKAAAGSLV